MLIELLTGFEREDQRLHVVIRKNRPPLDVLGWMSGLRQLGGAGSKVEDVRVIHHVAFSSVGCVLIEQGASGTRLEFSGPACSDGRDRTPQEEQNRHRIEHTAPLPHVQAPSHVSDQPQHQ